MAFFALLWKARTIEKYRINYETEKINSIVLGNTQMEQTLSQRWSHYRRDTKKRISKTFKKWYPEGSSVANFFLYLRTDQTFPNFLLKSVMGFVGGIILTYLCFMFFVFQLSISLIHATIMSSIIGVLLTLGLAFSYRIRCLVFLLIPQFFSRVGRYTLTCYALVLILTGPATNTLKNSEVLSESMACSQEQIKSSVHQLNDLMKKPFNTMKDSLKVMVDRLKTITTKVKETVVELDRLVLSIVSIIQSSFSWLQSVADICNAQLGTPYDRCNSAMEEGISDCKKHLGPDLSNLCDVAYVAQAACYSVKPFKAFCYATDFMDEAILASVKKKIRNFSEHLRAMFHVEVHMHHSYSYSSNTSRSASQVAAGIVTEIRNRADPLLTWLSWSSCVTSLFLLLIIFRAKYYQHMYETRSRFDNRYVTKELQELDLKRQRQGRETVLPLNRRERAKYINTTSFRLVASEKVYLNRSAVFMAITTFKLLIHMVADYSLYWVLMTIRYHGRYQTELMPGIPHSGAHVSGSGYVARLFSSIIGILDIPLSFPAPSPITCLPDPYPPDLRRYTQIGVLIFLLWFFALFEPYGLRLRHLIMGHYRPERAKARATWLYNHILRTRASFMKFARRKLHRDYKYSSGASLTFRQWITDHIPFQCLKSLLGLCDKEPYCLLCGITPSSDPDSELTRCQTRGCPGVYCTSCFQDIGNLCTICLSPEDYGDLSDISFEKGSDDSDSEHGDPGGETLHESVPLLHMEQTNRRNSRKSFHSYDERWHFFNESGPTEAMEAIDLLPADNYEQGSSSINILRRFYSLTSNLRIRYKEKQYTLNWVTKVRSENTYKIMPQYNDSFHSLPFEMEETFSETKSVGINTDKNHSMIISLFMNNFRQRRIRFSRNKHKNMKSSNKQHTQLFRFHNVSSSTSDSEPQVKHSVSEPNTKSLVYTKTLHSYNLNIPLISTNINVKSEKTNKAKNKTNLSKEFKGTMSFMKYFMKSSDIEVSNQNNDITLDNDNTGNPPIDNAEEVNNSVGDADNPELPDKKKKKKSKNKKQKRQRKPKDVKKIKKKDSRQGINEIHTFFSTHWNNFKCSLMKSKRSDSSTPKEKKNHKRRKKRKREIREVIESDTDECFGQKDTKQTRNLRISAFLAELEWTKKEYKKNKKAEAKNDSFLFPDGQRTVANNKIVGMVHLKNLPFQWREAPKKDPHCDCQDKKCSCPEKSDKCMNKIFGRLSKFSGKISTKKKIQKFRNKINTLDAPSSLMAKMLSTINAKREKSSAKIESSICIAKRTSFYQEVAKEVLSNNEPFDINTDMLFQNENFKTETIQEPSDDIGQSSKFISSSNLLRKELIVSRSTEKKKSPDDKKGLSRSMVNSRCRCDFYDDLQRKWTHVKNSISDKFKGPLDVMKNFRSSLFGPSCTLSTCPNKKEKIPKPVIIRENKKKIKMPTIKSSKKNKPVAIQTEKKNQSKMGQMAVQTNAKKDMETQLKEDEDVEKYIKEEIKKKAQANESTAQFDAEVCKRQMKLLLECLEKEKDKLSKSAPKSESSKLVVAKPSVEKPPAEKPPVEKPPVEKPPAEKPPVKKPPAENTPVEKPPVEKPPVEKPSVEKPLVVKPPVEKPAARKPKAYESEIVKPVARKSKAYESEVDKPAERKSDACKSEKYKPDARKLDACKPETYQPASRKSETSSHRECACPQTPPQSPETDCECNTGCESVCEAKIAGLKKVLINDPGIQPVLQHQDEGITVKPSTTSGGCQAKASPTCCNRSAIVRFEKKPRSKVAIHTAVGSSLRCLCDEGVQGSLQDTCTCATQHEPPYSTKTKTTIVKPLVVSSFAPDDEYPLAIKKNQHRHMAHKGTHFSKHRRKKSRDVKSGVSKRDQKLSLESSLCVLNRSSDAAKSLTEVFTDTITDSSVSSVSIRSQETRTDTTVCSLATVDYDTPRRRKFRVKVVTKTNQGTFTDKTRLHDTGTVTQDWWSPLVERKSGEDYVLEKKKKGYNIMEKQKREKRELKRRELKEMRDLKKSRNCGVTTDGRIVTFRSRTQIIPGTVPGVNDIMSPSRYLRESQRYYNELFAYNFVPAQMEFNCVSQIPKHLEKEKLRSPLGKRRNHHRKTKRLEECYSPRRQISPRKRFTESESPRKRHTPRHTNNRHYSKYFSPRKFK